jgi:replicative DNA helicase
VLDQVGGLAYLGSLARDTPTAANIRAYADIVRERSVLRQLITAGNNIVTSALEPEGREAREIVDDAERAVFEIAERGSRGKVGFRWSRACCRPSSIASTSCTTPRAR